MKKNFFYGWVNVAILWLVYIFAAVPFTYTFGIVSKGMASALGFSMTLTAAGYTCYSLFGALFSPVIGKCVKRFGAKKILLFGVTIFMVSSLLMAFGVKGVFLYFFVWSILLPIGMRCSTLVPMQDNVAKWFVNKRGLIIALIMTAGGVGGYLFTPILQKISEAYSWKAVWIFNSICGLIAFTLLLFLRNRPEDVGQEIDNGQTQSNKKQASAVFKTDAPWTLRSALLQPAFYMLVFIFFAGTYLMVIVGNYAISHLSTSGLNASDAAKAVGYFAIINTIGRLTVGTFSDKINLKYVMFPATLLALIGCIIMLFVDTMVVALLALILIGLGYGVLLVSPQTLLINYFGVKNYAEINGIYTMMSGILSSLPAVVIGLFYDLFGNYNAAWYIGATLMIFCGGCVIAIKPPVFIKSGIKEV